MTSDVLTKKGCDDGKNFVHIDGQCYVLPAYLLPRVEEIAEGDRVGFRGYNNILTGIWKLENPAPKVVSNQVPPKMYVNGRNERLIAFLALHRDAVQGATMCNTPDSRDFDQFMDDVFARAEEDLRKAFEKYGGA